MKVAFNGRAVFVCLLTMLAALSSSSAQETTKKNLPSAQAVIARNQAALGSEEAIGNLKSLAVEATVSIPQAGLQAEMKLFQSSDGRAALKIGNQEFGTDGKRIWRVSPRSRAQILEGEEAARIRIQLCLNSIAHYEEFFDKMACIGVEQFGGEECYVLKLQNGDLSPVLDYFSVASGLHAGSKLTTTVGDDKQEVTSVIGDHRKVGDFVMPHRTVAHLADGVAQEVVVTSMEINAEIPPDILEVPDGVKDLLK